MPQFYEIRIKGHLDKSWEDWFGGLALRHESNGETALTGAVPDQAALHGVLNRLRDLGVELVSVNPIEDAPVSGEEGVDESKQ
jgi:hypothetical protein